MGEKSGPRTFSAEGAQAFRNNYDNINWGKHADTGKVPFKFRPGDLVRVCKGVDSLGRRGVVIRPYDPDSRLMWVELDLGHQYLLPESWLEKREIDPEVPYNTKGSETYRQLVDRVNRMTDRIYLGMDLGKKAGDDEKNGQK